MTRWKSLSLTPAFFVVIGQALADDAEVLRKALSSLAVPAPASIPEKEEEFTALGVAVTATVVRAEWTGDAGERGRIEARRFPAGALAAQWLEFQDDATMPRAAVSDLPPARTVGQAGAGRREQALLWQRDDFILVAFLARTYASEDEAKAGEADFGTRLGKIALALDSASTGGSVGASESASVQGPPVAPPAPEAPVAPPAPPIATAPAAPPTAEPPPLPPAVPPAPEPPVTNVPPVPEPAAATETGSRRIGEPVSAPSVAPPALPPAPAPAAPPPSAPTLTPSHPPTSQPGELPKPSESDLKPGRYVINGKWVWIQSLDLTPAQEEELAQTGFTIQECGVHPRGVEMSNTTHFTVRYRLRPNFGTKKERLQETITIRDHATGKVVDKTNRTVDLDPAAANVNGIIFNKDRWKMPARANTHHYPGTFDVTLESTCRGRKYVSTTDYVVVENR